MYYWCTPLGVNRCLQGWDATVYTDSDACAPAQDEGLPGICNNGKMCSSSETYKLLYCDGCDKKTHKSIFLNKNY